MSVIAPFCSKYPSAIAGGFSLAAHGMMFISIFLTVYMVEIKTHLTIKSITIIIYPTYYHFLESYSVVHKVQLWLVYYLYIFCLLSTEQFAEIFGGLTTIFRGS